MKIPPAFLRIQIYPKRLRILVIAGIAILAISATSISVYAYHHRPTATSRESSTTAPHITTQQTPASPAPPAVDTTVPSPEPSSSLRSSKPTTPPSTASDTPPRATRPTPLPGNAPTTVTPNPYCPAPQFTVSVTRNPSSYDLYIDVIPGFNDPSNTPECGGVGYNTPVATYPTNGNLCSGIIYPISYLKWGMACSIYSTATYGTYPYSFTITGTNGFNVSTTKTAYYTINYQQE